METCTEVLFRFHNFFCFSIHDIFFLESVPNEMSDEISPDRLSNLRNVVGRNIAGKNCRSTTFFKILVEPKAFVHKFDRHCTKKSKIYDKHSS